MLILKPLHKILFFALVLFSLVSLCFSQSRAKDYVSQGAGRFQVIYCPEDAGVIPSFWETLRFQVPQVEQQLGLALADTVRFVIVPTEAEWTRVTGGAPIWAHGISFSQQGVAVLKSPRFGLTYGPLPVTAVHEYIHLLLHAGAPRAEIPRWLDEGLAQLLAGQMNYIETTALSRAVLSGRLHSFWQIEGLMSMRDTEARQAYAESIVAVEQLRSRFGMSGLSNLVHSLRQGKPFEETFYSVYGIKIGRFESDYLQFVRENYKLSIFGDTELWVSALFIILILAAGLFAWKRRKKKLAEWKEEEIVNSEAENEPKLPPYIVHYTLVRRPDSGQSEDNENKSSDQNP
jgi:hypothetical protein